MLSLSLKDACRLTGFGRDLIYDLLRAGEIQSFVLGKRRIFFTEVLRTSRSGRRRRRSKFAPARTLGARGMVCRVR
jgi:hypothetical protein